MLKNIAEKIWWFVPYNIRLKFIRFFQQKFTVSVVAIVSNENDEILVLDHFFRPRYSWGLPGGFIERGEAPENGVKRELREETGLELENLRLVFVRSVGTHIEILFRASATGEAIVSSPEIRDLGWFLPNELPKMSDVQVQLIKHVLTK